MLNTDEENDFTWTQEGDTIWFDIPQLVGYPFASTTWKEISMDGLVASCDVEMFVSISGDANAEVSIRTARNQGSVSGWMYKPQGATNRYALGWIRAADGPTYNKALYYKQANGNAGIYLDGVRMNLRN